MKASIFLSITLMVLFGSCGQNNSSQQVNVNPNNTAQLSRLEVYCFHGTRQCTTCKNMKANTLKALTLHYSKQLQDSSIVFKIVDVDLPENEVLAEKFQATGTALMLNWVKDGKDSIIDMSDFAFEKANDEAIFIKDFSRRIAAFVK
jgi:hypothetical protein